MYCLLKSVVQRTQISSEIIRGQKKNRPPLSHIMIVPLVTLVWMLVQANWADAWAKWQ